MVKSARTKKGMSIGQRLLVVASMLLGVAFLPVAIVLGVGMLPSMVCMLTDTTRDRTRTLTVALLNFVACYPFLIEVALEKRNMDGAYATISDPAIISIMFAGAAVGYFLDWTCAGISNVIMTGRARQRQEVIKKSQDELVRRWGREVTGTIPLDPDGFPLESNSENAG